MPNSLYNLTKGQSVEIAGESYFVAGLMELRQGNFYWKEFALQSRDCKVKWLSAEKNEAITTCMLYEELPKGGTLAPEQTIEFNGERYTLFDSGPAKVTKAYSIPDTAEGDQCEFWEYVSERDSNKVFSIEKWEDGTEYSVGRIMQKRELKFPNTQSLYAEERGEKPVYPLEKMRKLAMGQNIEIKGKKHTVVGSANMRQENFKWKEYKLSNGQWLCIEASGQGDYAMSIHTAVAGILVDKTSDSVTYKGKKYALLERGNAVVSSFNGNVDYDPHEKCRFEEYEAADGSLFSVEVWSDETENSHGELLAYKDVKVLDTVSKVKNPAAMGNAIKYLVIAGIALFIFAVYIYPMFNLTPSINSQLSKDASFEYVTAVTLNDGKNTKSQVYKANGYSLETACEALIKMDPERITFVNTLTDIANGEKMIKTSREVVLVYESEEGDVMVQITPVAVPSSSYNYYRPRYRVRLHNFTTVSYDWEPTSGTNLSSEGIDSNYYYLQIANARQESINARNASGGGTGFGK